MATSTISGRVRELLEATEPFKGLPEDVRNDLLPAVSLRYYDAGDVILEQGRTDYPGLYVVESGIVRVMNLDHNQLVKKCAVGDSFGAFGLVKGGASIYEAKAVEPTVCLLISGKRFADIYDEYDAFAVYFDREVQRYVRRRGAHVDVGGGHLLFSRRLRELALPKVATCAPDDSVQSVARAMDEKRTGAAVVLRKAKLEGIVTDRDIRTRYAARGLSADVPMKRIMTKSVEVIGADETLFDAMVRLLDVRLSRLVVVDRNENRDRPLGILSAQHVSHFRGKDPLATVRYVDEASALADLASVREELNEQFQSLFEQSVSPDQLKRIIASVNDRVVRRVVELVEQEARASAGRNELELTWALVLLGSGGRGEMSLTSEHDIALVYANPASSGEAEQAADWFTNLTKDIKRGLASCGFPVAERPADDARRCRPLSGWISNFRTWIHEADREDVAEISGFFDFRSVYGDVSLVGELREAVEDALNVQAMETERHFLRLMAQHLRTYKASISLFERLIKARSGDSIYNLTERAVLPVVASARILALEVRYVESATTFDRLQHASEKIPDLRPVIDSALDGYRHVVDFHLEHQLNQVEGGEPPSDTIDLASLPKMDQQILRRATAAISKLQQAVQKRYERE